MYRTVGRLLVGIFFCTAGHVVAQNDASLTSQPDAQHFECVFTPEAHPQQREAFRMVFAGTSTVGTESRLSGGGTITRTGIGRGLIIHPDGNAEGNLYAVGSTDGVVRLLRGQDLRAWIDLNSSEAAVGSRHGRCYLVAQSEGRFW